MIGGRIVLSMLRWFEISPLLAVSGGRVCCVGSMFTFTFVPMFNLLTA